MRAALRRLKDPYAARRAAFVGGALLFLTGGTGAIALVRLGIRLLEVLPPVAARTLAPLIIVAAFIAALGGLSVILGAALLLRRRILGKLFITLGASVGLLGFSFQLITALVAGWGETYGFLETATTAQGLAVLFVVYAQLRA